MQPRSAQPAASHRTQNGGFTLVEVMISIFVLGVLTLVFAASVPVARKTARMNGQYAQALSLCQHKIDQLRAVGYGRLTYTELDDPENIIDSSPNQQPYSFTGVDGVSACLPNPTTALTIDDIDGRPNERLVSVTITWRNENEAKTNSARLSAIIANVE